MTQVPFFNHGLMNILNIHEFQIISISGQESTPPTTTSTASLKHISTTPLHELQDFETIIDGERLYHFDLKLRLDILGLKYG